LEVKVRMIQRWSDVAPCRRDSAIDLDPKAFDVGLRVGFSELSSRTPLDTFVGPGEGQSEPANGCSHPMC
jgi:hypothetical protein